MQKFKYHMFVGVLVAAVAGLVICAPGVSLAQNDQVVSKSQMTGQRLTAAEVAEVQAFWTPQRMQEAIPMLPMRDISEMQAAPTLTIPPTGPATKVFSGKPGDQVKVLTGEAAKQRTSGLQGIEPLYSGGSFWTYTRYRIFPENKGKLYLEFPYRLVGKLYFVGTNGGLYVASASVVGAANYSVIWTAAHCVYTNTLVGSPQGFNSYWFFLPGEYAGKTKLGVVKDLFGIGLSKGWVAWDAWVATAWAYSNYWPYDFGALVIVPSKKGPIAAVLGWLGILFNVSAIQQWTLLGYPAQAQVNPDPPGYSFDGEHQELCASTYNGSDKIEGGNYTMGTGCDQTPGCSGGPWIIDFNPLGGDSNYVNGNFSYYYGPGTLRSYSSYYNATAYNVWYAAQTDVP